jgi:channel protein (hemolysin III family)
MVHKSCPYFDPRISGELFMPPSEIYAIPGFRDPVSSLTHLVGAGVFAVLTVFLLRRGWGSLGRIASLGVFAFTFLFLLSMSGVYHLLAPGTARAVLRRLDHGAIFAMIAGTFTPVHTILFRGIGRWGPLVFIWTAAAAGIVLKTIFFGDISSWLGAGLFLIMGWVGIVPGAILWRRYGSSFIRPLICGALAYTVGAILDGLRWPVLLPGIVGPHEVFHMAVLAGASFHWRFISQFATGHVSAS